MGIEIMNARTKNRQPEQTLRAMAQEALRTVFMAFSSEELGGGLCNAVYKVICDQTTYVIKIGSEEQVEVMAHEEGYLNVEANMLKLFGDRLDIKAPHLIYHDVSGAIIPEPWFMMEYLEGVPLLQVEQELSKEEKESVAFAIGQICQDICSLPAPAFGLPGVASTWTDKNSIFVHRLFELLFQDATKVHLTIPGPAPFEVLSLIDQCSAILDEVTMPCHIHTDTWAGNILMKGHEFAGLVDHAAILYGDPLMSHDFHDFSPQPSTSFLAGFGKKEISSNEQLRIVIYKIWQRLGMILENGFRGYDDPGHYNWVFGEYEKELGVLYKMLKK